MYNYGYGAPPPSYGAYGAYPAPAYGAAPPAAYGAPPPAYGAPPAAYGAPPAPYGASPVPYGAPAPQYGAQPPSLGIAPPPSAAQARSPAPTQPPSSTQPGQAPQPQSQSQSQPQSQPQPQPAGSSSGSLIYPSLNAPPPSQVVPTEVEHPHHSSSPTAQRPSSASAYHSMGGNPAAAHASSAPAPASRPASAAPSSPSPYAYGAPPAPQQPAPQQPAAPYTYGQPAPQAAAPPGPPAAPPATYMPPTTYAPAPGHGGRRRRALLIGCSYAGTSAALNGCLNDVKCIQFCLQQRFGFTEQQFVVLQDDPGRHPDYRSTKTNIYRAIQWLMMDQQPGDSLFFHFSGHGSQQYDRNGDEEDGFDETICPTDFRSAGMIVDDELHRLMVRPLQPGVTLHAVVDACHSGTALDLPFRAKTDGGGRWYWKGRARYDKMTAGGTVFQFGACKDSQVAQDTKALSGRAYTGAATFCFIDAIEKYGVQQTYGQVLSHMMSALRAATGPASSGLGSAGALIAGLLLGVNFGGGGQTPVLSCDKQVDLYATRLSL